MFHELIFFRLWSWQPVSPPATPATSATSRPICFIASPISFGSALGKKTLIQKFGIKVVLHVTRLRTFQNGKCQCPA